MHQKDIDERNNEAFIVWEERFNLGIEEVDNQHKKLVDIINKLYIAESEGKAKELLSKVLKELKDYTVHHFTDEEKFLETQHYPGLESHKLKHREFIKTLAEFEVEYDLGDFEISKGILSFLKNWLLNHILNADRDYINYIDLRDKEGY